MWRTWQFLMSPSWLTLTQQPAGPPPRWLTRWQWGYTAALQRFWLDKLSIIRVARPTESIAHDLRTLEESFIDPAIGQPGQGQAVSPTLPLICADGIAGRSLAGIAELLQRLEDRLLLQGRGGAAEQLLQRLGAYLRTVEGLLEQPRYLMMAVMATFVVIL